mgnify:CR=1 FL=1
MKKFRDTIILDDIDLVVTTDSAAGIGEKEHDAVYASIETVSYYAAFVPIVEALCVRSKPFVLVDTLCNERVPYGEKIMRGIKRAMRDASMDIESGFTGSTEENFVTTMTGIGVTVLSRGHDIRKAQKGDAVYAIGRALVGEELAKHEYEAMSMSDYIYLSSQDYIHDIVPIGSQGAMHELAEIESYAGLKARIVNDDFDYSQSAGPSTLCLITMKEEDFNKLNLKKAINLLAYME